jgi:hypothetical protein
MNARMLLVRATLGVALGMAAPLVFAQTGTGGHENRANNPQWQACKKQADDKKLQRGPERKAFMQDCLKAAQGSGGQKPPG